MKKVIGSFLVVSAFVLSIASGSTIHLGKPLHQSHIQSISVDQMLNPGIDLAKKKICGCIAEEV